jgi:hypothetical protein
MAVPTGYTETTFKTYLHKVAGDVASVLGWSIAGGDYDEVVYEALFMYEADDITTISGRDNVRKLRVLGRVALWRQAMSDAAARYDFAADGGDYKRSQMLEMIAKALDEAEYESLAYDDTLVIHKTRVTYADYYTPPDLDDDE